jgi:CRISPR-associated protein Cas2
MLIVSYDIADDKLRDRFAKYLKKFGYRLQYSVFQIKNSKRILDNITTEINTSFGKQFKQTDSVIIFHLSQQCKKYCFGYAVNDDDELIIVD